MGVGVRGGVRVRVREAEEDHRTAQRVLCRLDAERELVRVRVRVRRRRLRVRG